MEEIASDRPEHDARAQILIVDDSPENLTVLGELLRTSYRIRAANSGGAALRLARVTPLPDLILLDVMMPDMDGLAVLRILKGDPALASIPVLFVTAMASAGDEERGLAEGAVDYVTKPIQPAVVLARVRTHLELKRARDRLQDQNAILEAEVARRVRENQIIQDATICALGRLAEIRDPETGNHILRTQHYVAALAQRVRAHPRFRDALSDHVITLLMKSAPLHDIGKVGIPDEILLKPGRLTAEEWEVMKTHARLGAEAIERAERDVSQPLEFLTLAKEIAGSHHERWDGSGYPEGRSGEDIPLSARLMAVADVFDALISRRVYKAPVPLHEARSMMAEQRGRHFDPDILDAFLEGYDELCTIAARYKD